MNTETATFGAGCFWGVEVAFRQTEGVLDAAAGYAGGNRPNPTYEEVCTDRTGHAEVVQVTFDPARVSYERLLDLFFTSHDPTQLNRQGPDHGTQYRSTLFINDAAQAEYARAYIAQLSNAHVFKRPIATKIEATGRFIPAEAYHQDFMRKNPAHPYILVNDRPKVAALRRIFPMSWKA